MDLQAQKQASKSAKDLRQQSLKNLQAEAFKPVPAPKEVEDEEDDGEEVEERVMIRSFDEKVAVGGKNFSESAQLANHAKIRELMSQARASVSCSLLRVVC